MAESTGASRADFYNWKIMLIGKGGTKTVKDKREISLLEEKERLEAEAKTLEEKIRRARFELDVLEAAAEIIKKTEASIRHN